MKTLDSKISLLVLFATMGTLAAPARSETPAAPPATETVGLSQVRGLDFYYGISTWLGDRLSAYFRDKILAEAQGFEWTAVTKAVSRSSPPMFFDRKKVTPSAANTVEFWGLEESSTEFFEDGRTMPKPSVAYRYHFDCGQPAKSKLLYAIKFSGPTGSGRIEQIDTHFNGQWRRGGSDLFDQSLSNFKPFLTEACSNAPA
jgi:hypothetical protein